jgi:flagellar motor switch protein FliN
MSEPNTAEAAETVVGESERRSVSPENQYKRSIFGLPVNVVVSIGQKKLSVAELLKLKPDTIIPLTAKIDDPIELLVEDRLIAHGELIELEDGAIGVRLTQIEEDQDG